MKRLIIVLIFAVSSLVHGQSAEGVVTYQRTQYWTKILPKLTFLSKEEMDRELRTWGAHDDGWKTKYQLLFSENESKFTEIAEVSEYGYNRRPSEYMIYRDFKNEKRVEIEDISARQYMIMDSLTSYSWKILNKIKEVNGQLCMMATTQDTVRNQKIVAWFANNIPSSAGPERYFGLPGLIMELDIDDGAVIITAINVEMKPVAEELKLPKKSKGKKITGIEYNKMIKDVLDTAIKGHRYPYSAVRF
jgi:GLPGLI family protein